MKKSQTRFTSDSQLLAELGERLIATPQIALGELIKNAYDADATRVNIWLSNNNSCLNVLDDGHGMSEADFKGGWMRIASTRKLLQQTSPRLGRPLTGSKGVGRFAVRLLGDDLLLATSSGQSSGLRAEFPWYKFASGSQIGDRPIDYWTGASEIWKGILNPPPAVGTLLRISRLRSDWDDESLARVAKHVLELQTPSWPQFAARKRPGKTVDPGFEIFFAEPGNERTEHDPTSEILGRSAITLRLRLRKQRLTLEYQFRSGRPKETYKRPLPNTNLIGRLDADIRFLPQRPGAFAALPHHDGRTAAAWVRRNAGVRVYDRGFRVPPYGSPGNDWLGLARDAAVNRRDWDSEITKLILPPQDSVPADNAHPALHLPSAHQVMGCVSLQSHRPASFPHGLRPKLLQPAMDRQGFVENEGLRQLYTIVRTGMEVLAYLDLDEELRQKAAQREQAAGEFQKQLESAISEVANDPAVPAHVRRSVGVRLRHVQAEAHRLDRAQEDASLAIETLGLLGVVAAFMTHEMTTTLRELQRIRSILANMKTTTIPKVKRSGFNEASEAVEAGTDALERHIRYVRQFATNVRSPPTKRYKARAAVREVVRQFEYFTKPRSIVVEQSVDSSLLAPRLPMSVYSGLLLNLFTNALKAVLARGDGAERKVAIQATSDGGVHIVRVSDSGVGIPHSIRGRIFDPLFSTTSDEGPLGPGMGLGLYIVQRVAKSHQGSIRVVEARDDYVTTIELRIPDA